MSWCHTTRPKCHVTIVLIMTDIKRQHHFIDATRQNNLVRRNTSTPKRCTRRIAPLSNTNECRPQARCPKATPNRQKTVLVSTPVRKGDDSRARAEKWGRLRRGDDAKWVAAAGRAAESPVAGPRDPRGSVRSTGAPRSAPTKTQSHPMPSTQNKQKKIFFKDFLCALRGN